MRHRHVRAVPALLAGLFLVVGAHGIHAQGFQWPDEQENLQVLPDSIDGQELRRVMTGFTDALGVRCSHCHVGEEGADLSEYDFPSDDKEAKETARIMLRMVGAINGEHLTNLDHDVGPDRVTCLTCHRGAEEPELIQDVIYRVVRRQGVDSAVARYRQLRERYYAGFTYDFRVGPLAELATRLLEEDRTEAGLRVAELEVEHHPDSYRAHFALARAQRRTGDDAGARASLERAIELAPNERVRAFLERQLEASAGG